MPVLTRLAGIREIEEIDAFVFQDEDSRAGDPDDDDDDDDTPDDDDDDWDPDSPLPFMAEQNTGDPQGVLSDIDMVLASEASNPETMPEENDNGPDGIIWDIDAPSVSFQVVAIADDIVF